MKRVYMAHDAAQAMFDKLNSITRLGFKSNLV